MKCIFSVDVEDWFHISGLVNTPELPTWESFPSRLEKNFMQLLDIFSQKNVQVTCFFLGWVAEKFPHLVKEAKERGHEIASHGYSHRLAYEMSQEEFLADVRKAKQIIEDVSRVAVLGYRAPGFSVTKDTPWFFNKLMEAGYTYDSSVFSAPRVFGGLKSKRYAPYAVGNGSCEFIEFPITAIELFGKPFCFFGGGYLRLTPYFLIKEMGLKVIKEKRPVVFYIHPREIDPDQPRLLMNMQRRFNSYVNLKTTRNKIIKILDQFEITTFTKFIKEHKIMEEPIQ
ncbi:MAG: polysaccharide deacetylase family protein [Candidatus Omnitrophica bacterium]|nr:polysaccharide deacetylase family protein [Candidatus Omnitrophota bacterium]